MRIKLTQGKFAIVGPRDYKFLNQFKWYYDYGYAVRNGPKVNGRQATIRMHRIILERMGYTNFKASDHTNQDKLDNRRCNLRPATHYQNMCNRSKRKHNTSGFKGVHWRKDRKKWQVTITVDGKRIPLGSFDDKLEAARAYNKAAKKYHKEFACLN